MISPIGDRLLVKPKSPEEKTKGGLLLSQQDDEKQDTETVVAVGAGDLVQEFEIGEEIIYQKYGPANIKFEKEKFVIVHLDEILAIVKEAN